MHSMITNPAAAMDETICGRVWTSRTAAESMEVLSCDIGPRPSGSKGMREAAGAVMDWLRAAGVNNVHTEPVPVFAWQDRPSTLERTGARPRRYASVQHVHSAAAKISAPLVDAGAGNESDLDRIGDRIAGAVLLVNGHVASGTRFVPMQVRVARMCERGAAGILMRNVVPGAGPAIELIGVERDVPIPMLGISWESAAELSVMAREAGCTVRLETSGASFHSECVNTIGEIGPADENAEIIALSAHMDSFHTNPGSFDNLTGVVTLLEIARCLAPLQERFVRRLRLLVYTGEEYGFLGSRSYVASHRAELDRFRFVFNMDSLWPATADGIAVMWAPEMRDYIENAFRGTARGVDARNLFCMSSDYLPYMLEGIACARPAGFEAAFPPYSHTEMDTPDKVPLDWIRLNAMTHAQLLVRLICDPRPLPVARKTAHQVHKLLEAEAAASLIRVYGFDTEPS
jgi:hypothetical protein